MAFYLSDANQYGRYGKTRAVEDARRYLREKEELEREKDHIRNALVLLRKEKHEAKERMKVATGVEIYLKHKTLPHQITTVTIHVQFFCLWLSIAH